MLLVKLSDQSKIKHREAKSSRFVSIKAKKRSIILDFKWNIFLHENYFSITTKQKIFCLQIQALVIGNLYNKIM